MWVKMCLEQACSFINQQAQFNYSRAVNQSKMDNSITNYKPLPQVTKVIDNFEAILPQITQYLEDSSVVSLKLYELIVQQSSHLENESFYIVLLIQLYIIRQALHQVNPQIEFKCREKLKQTTEKVKSYILNHNKICNSTRKLSQALLHYTNYQQAQRIFNNFFIEHCQFIYSQSTIIWKLVIFNTFLKKQQQKCVEERIQADAFLDQFKAYLSNRQNHTMKKLTCLRQQKMFLSSTELVNIGRQKGYMSKLKQDRSVLSNQQMPRYRYNITIKEMMQAQINLETIGLVEGSQAYKCPYIIFLIPFAYLLAQCLTYYSNHKQLYIYHIFNNLCQRINKIKNGSNPQLPIPEIDDCIIDCINFTKYKDSQLRDKLAKFISKHQLKISIFMPFYYQIFSFHAFQKYLFVQRVLAQKISIQQKRNKMKQRIQQMYQSCNKYNDESL